MIAPTAESAVLDFDGFLGALPQDRRTSIEQHLQLVPEEGRAAHKQKLAAKFFVSETTGVPLEQVHKQWDVVRSGFAESQGGDWLAVKGDDAAFSTKLHEQAVKRQDERFLLQGPDDEADTQAKQESLMFKSQEAAFAGKPYADAFSEWETAHKHRPGYDPARASHYATIAAETHQAVAEKIAKVRPLADQALAEISAFRKEDGGQMAPFALLRGMSPEEKNIAFRLMTEGVKTEEKGRGQAFMEAVGRGFENLVVGGGSAKVRAKLLQTKFRAGDMVTGKTAEAELMADLRSGSGAMDSAGELEREISRKTNGRALTAEEAKQWNADLAGALEDLDTAETLRKFGQEVVDPAKAGGGFFQKLVLPLAESTAIMTSLAVPGGWATALTVGADSYANDEYLNLRERGMDAEQAQGIAGVTGMAQAALDKLQVGLLAKGIPSVGRTLEKFAMSGSRAGRLAVNFGGTVGAETAIELTQDHVIPALIQDNLTSDPAFDVQWGKVWSDVAKTAPDTALGMVLLSGLGGIAQTRQQSQFVKEFSSSPSAMRARGYSMEAIEEIQSAAGDQKGILLAQHLPAKAPRGGEQKALVADVQRLAAKEAKDFELAQASELSATKEAADYAIRVTRKGEGWVVTKEGGATVTVDTVEAARRIREDLRQAGSQEEADALVSIIDAWHSKAPADTERETTLTGETVKSDGDTITGTKDGQIVREITDAATLETIRQEARMDSGGSEIDVIVNGSNTVEFVDSVANAAKQTIQRLELNQSESVALTAVHEQLESALKSGMAKGSITARDIHRAIAPLRDSFNPDTARTDSERNFRIRVSLLSEGRASETELRETVVELAVADIIGRRKDGEVMPAGSITTAVRAMLDQASDAQTVKAGHGFLAMLRAVRHWFRAVFGTVAALRKAKREGKAQDFEALVNKLLGLDQAQLEADTATEVEATAKEAGVELAMTASVSAGERVELVMKRLDAALKKNPAKRRQMAAEANRRLQALADRFKFAGFATDEADSKKDRMIRDLRTYNALLSSLPPEIRANMGGFVKLAQLGDKGRMKEMTNRIDRLSELVEDFLKVETTREVFELIQQAKPQREGGQKSKGKLGAEAHRYFDQAERVIAMSEEGVEAERAAIAALYAQPELTDAQALELFEREQILDTFGAWDNKTAADMDAALSVAQEVYDTGRNRWRTIEENRLNEVKAMASQVVETLGGASYAGSQAQKTGGKVRFAKKLALDLKSFAEVLESFLGKEHPLVKRWADSAREGFAKRNDEVRAMRKRWKEALESATGETGVKSRRVLWDMARDQTVKVETAGKRSGSTQEVPIDLIDGWIAGTSSPSALGFSEAEAQNLIIEREAMEPDDRRQLISMDRSSRTDRETVPMTQAEGLFVTMLGAQEQYADGLDKAGFTPEAIASIEAQLTEPAKKLRAFMQAEYRDGYAPLAAQFERMFGVALPQIKNYAPAAFYHQGAEREMSLEGGIAEGGMRSGFLKNRKHHTAAPRLENAFATFFGHAAQTAHWKGLGQFVREFSGVIGKPEVKQAIEARHGTEMLQTLTAWVKNIEGNGLQQSSGLLDRALSWITSSQAYIALAWKLGTLMKQSSALLGAAYRMPLGAYARGFSRLLSGQLETSRLWNSPAIQRRLETGFAPEVRSALADVWNAKPTLRSAALEKGMELIGLTDAFFTTGSAAIAHDYHFRQAKEAGLSDEAADAAAMREIEDIIGRTAQPADVVNRSLFEARQGAFGRLLFMFASEARQKSSLWLTAWGNTLTGNATADDARVLVLSHLILAPMLHTITSAWRDMRDDDDDEIFDAENWDPMDYLKAIVAGPLSGIPLIGEALSGFRNDGILGRFVNLPKNLAQLFTGPKENEAEKIEWYIDRLAKVMQSADAFTGVAGSVLDQVSSVADNFLPDTTEEAEKKDRAAARRDSRED